MGDGREGVGGWGGGLSYHLRWVVLHHHTSAMLRSLTRSNKLSLIGAGNKIRESKHKKS